MKKKNRKKAEDKMKKLFDGLEKAEIKKLEKEYIDIDELDHEMSRIQEKQEDDFEQRRVDILKDIKKIRKKKGYI